MVTAQFSPFLRHIQLLAAGAWFDCIRCIRCTELARITPTKRVCAMQAIKAGAQPS
jgi:hypothetical protein